MLFLSLIQSYIRIGGHFPAQSWSRFLGGRLASSLTTDDRRLTFVGAVIVVHAKDTVILANILIDHLETGIMLLFFSILYSSKVAVDTKTGTPASLKYRCLCCCGHRGKYRVYLR